MLGKIIVAAIEGRDDFAVVTERLLQRAPRTDGSVFDARTDIAFFFATDLGEELIQIVDDADLCAHGDNSENLLTEKSEIRMSKSETNKAEIQSSKSETCRFGIFLCFDHLDLFRISDFEIYLAHVTSQP